MKAFLIRFWSAAVSLAGIAGLYIGAVAIDQAAAFWIVMAIALVVGGGPPVARKTLEWVSRIRTYRSLLARVAQAEISVEELRGSLAAASKEARDKWEAGIKEGYARIRGMLLALEGEPPPLVAIGEADGAVVLIARRLHGNEVGARYRVVDEYARETKGVVEAHEIDDESGTVLLRCVEALAEPFWRHLLFRAPFDTSPPWGVVLARCEYDIGPSTQPIEEPAAPISRITSPEVRE
ncbi:MAG: hypothetical protein GEV12_00700 [Micromonosporaceae bacterium]|nr:hypothetical protein [Micromonosporaceae bacterium]